MGFSKDLARRALSLSQRAVERLMSDPGRAQQIASAVGSVQRGKKRLDQGQEELMRALNLATKADFKALGKELAGAKRRTRELNERLEEFVQRRSEGH